MLDVTLGLAACIGGTKMHASLLCSVVLNVHIASEHHSCMKQV